MLTRRMKKKLEKLTSDTIDHVDQARPIPQLGPEELTVFTHQPDAGYSKTPGNLETRSYTTEPQQQQSVYHPPSTYIPPTSVNTDANVDTNYFMSYYKPENPIQSESATLERPIEITEKQLLVDCSYCPPVSTSMPQPQTYQHTPPQAYLSYTPQAQTQNNSYDGINFTTRSRGRPKAKPTKPKSKPTPKVKKIVSDQTSAATKKKRTTKKKANLNSELATPKGCNKKISAEEYHKMMKILEETATITDDAVVFSKYYRAEGLKLEQMKQIYACGWNRTVPKMWIPHYNIVKKCETEPEYETYLKLHEKYGPPNQNLRNFVETFGKLAEEERRGIKRDRDDDDPFYTDEHGKKRFKTNNGNSTLFKTIRNDSDGDDD